MLRVDGGKYSLLDALMVTVDPKTSFRVGAVDGSTVVLRWETAPPGGMMAVNHGIFRSFYRLPPRHVPRRLVRSLVEEAHGIPGGRVVASWPVFQIVPPVMPAGHKAPVFTVRRAIAWHLREDEGEIEGARRYQPTRTPCRVYSVGNDYLTATPGPRPPRSNSHWMWERVPAPDVPACFGWCIWRAMEGE